LATGTKLVSRRSCHKSSASSKAIYSSPNGSWSTPPRGSNSVPSAEARPSVSARLSMSAAQRKRLPAEAGYTKGVPMGGDLRDAPDGKAPTFLVAALKDPIGANLDRIQIIKGWLGQDGQTREKVYDVVWGDADERQPGPDGKLPLVGTAADVAKAIWTNTIGAPELITVSKDPDFDPGARAFYYARVIEILTPRWTAYDAKRFGTQMPPEAPMTTQERAYTSPIWYTPG
jgi:hypothetical protein